MADRYFAGLLRSMDRAPVMLTGSVTMGAGSISATDCLGFAVTRSGAGDFRITLEDKYGDNTNASLLWAGVSLYGTPEDKFVFFKAPALSSKQVDFVTWDVSGAAAADPASGVVMRILLVLSNTSAPRKGV